MVKVVPGRQFTVVAEVPRRHLLSTGLPYCPPTFRPLSGGHLRYIHAYICSYRSIQTYTCRYILIHIYMAHYICIYIQIWLIDYTFEVLALVLILLAS